MPRKRNNLAGIGRTDIERGEAAPSTHGVARVEQETIICFNKEDSEAHVFTYEFTWQRHIEQRFGVKPIMDNGFGGKEYVVPKSRIGKPLAPRAKKVLTEEQKAKARERIVAAQKARHQKP